MIGIYKITSPSGKVYIGQSWNLKQRFSKYKSGDSSRQPKLNNSLKCYGFDAHIIEIVQELPQDISQSIIDQLEMAYISNYKEAGIELLNLNDGGKNCKATPETRLKQSLQKRGIPLVQRIGKEYAEKQINRMRKKKGIPHTKTHIENISKALMGKKLSPDHVNKLRGQKRTLEQIERFRKAQLGKKRTEEQKKRLSEIHKIRLAEMRLNKTGRYAIS